MLSMGHNWISEQADQDVTDVAVFPGTLLRDKTRKCVAPLGKPRGKFTEFNVALLRMRDIVVRVDGGLSTARTCCPVRTFIGSMDW